MGNKKILLIGGGGHCHSVIDAVLSNGTYNDMGIVEKTGSEIKDSIFGVPIVGCDNDLSFLLQSGWDNAVITVGSIGPNNNRMKLFYKLKNMGFNVPPIIDKTAIVANDASIGEGSFIGKGSVINAGAQVGVCSIINTRAIIEHDCVIGDFVHISPGCVVCGGVNIDDNTHLGAASVVIQEIKIGSDSLIGAGSVVVKSVPAGVVAFGNPCRVVR